MAESRTKKGLRRGGSNELGKAIGKLGGKSGAGKRGSGKLGGQGGSGKLGPDKLGGKGGSGKLGPDKLGGDGEAEEVAFSAEVEALGDEILALKREEGEDSVMAQVAMGERLEKVRKQLAHGKWMRFLKAKVGVVRMHAGRMIKLAQWGARHPRLLQQVSHLGPGKVRVLVKTPPEAVKRLVARAQHRVPGKLQPETLRAMTAAEMERVLRVLSGDMPEDEAVAKVEAEEVTAELEQDARGVVRWTNKLVKLNKEGNIEVLDVETVVKVRKKLLSSLKKLDKLLESNE